MSLAKLHKTIGLLKNMDLFNLYYCEKLQKLSNFIEEVQMLMKMYLEYYNNIETLFNFLGALTSLEALNTMHCTSITTLPMSIGPFVMSLHIEDI
jgi:hypothetical protein